MNYWIIPGLKERPDSFREDEKVKKIINVACEFYQTTVNLLARKTNLREVVTPRHVIAYLLRTNTKLTVRQIGGIFNQSHCGASRSIKLIRGYLKASDPVGTDVKQLQSLIN